MSDYGMPPVDPGEHAKVLAKNEQLSQLLQAARAEVQSAKEQIEGLNTPPSGYGVLLRIHDDHTVDVYTSGREMRVSVSPEVEHAGLAVGLKVQTSLESGIVVAVEGFVAKGMLYSLREVLPPQTVGERARAIVVGHSDEEQVVGIADSLDIDALKAGDLLLVDTKAGLVLERMPKAGAEELVLEEIPDVSYDDIGGLRSQIKQIFDAVELPYLHPELFQRLELSAPKGVLLYGPPGCGKTMIAKAVAASLARRVREVTGNDDARAFFLNVKGPELLNKFVGETERHIREIFQQAREKASSGMPVIVFFDEMESLFRTRGSGISSDMESTVVPQLLSEIDGVEGLENVIVIGASNREDKIDPAVLRPGRLDVKIKVQRPDAGGAREIFAKYLKAGLPLNEQLLLDHGGDAAACVHFLITRTVEQMYSESEANKFIEVTYASGSKEVLYFKDFSSGAMIKNIVDRAKKYAINDALDGQPLGLTLDHLQKAVVDEFAENEDLPNVSSPDDWARISGKKGERIVHLRTLLSEGKLSTPAQSRQIQEVTGTGQYL